MPITVRPTRWSCYLALVSSVILAGCGGEAPPMAASPSTDATETGTASVAPAVLPEGSTGEQPIANPEPTAGRDRATIDATVERARHDANQATGAVKHAVGDAQVEAKQAAAAAVVEPGPPA